MVAIILVNYNGSSDTIDCIKSLSSMREVEYEIIVVDNCSTDDSIDKLKQSQKEYSFTLLQAEQNNGFSYGNNIGIKYAKNADFYLLINNDTVVTTDFLKKLIAEFHKNPKCGVTTPKILYYSQPNKIWYAGGSFDQRTARSEHNHYNQNNNINEKSSQKVTFASGCCLCVSRNTIEKVGLLNEDFFLYEEDAEFCYRITEAGLEIVYIPDSVIFHKVSASTGQGSPMSQYYTVRNKYSLIRMHFKGINKILAYIYCTAQFMFRCIKKEQDFKYYRLGTKAFMRNETGKARENIT